MLGKLLDRRYQVTQVLGAGGFGRTYLAQDTRRPGNPICVVKQLKPVSSEPSFLETARRLFTSEAETLEQLGNHPQIPRLLAYFEEDQEFYLVQEFIEGHTFTQELQPGQRWEESRVVELLREVLTILDFVHSHGVIHRDIKPDNLIRRNSDHKLVLVDFGAVKQMHTQLASAYGQASNTVAVGTPGYMASEQARGQPRPSSDIYALGIIGIQALTGLMPMQMQEDLSTGEILWEHLVSVNRGLAAILTRMVRYHFKDRYQSAAEALQALQQLNSPYSPTPYATTPKYPSANDVPPAGQRFPQPSYPIPQSEKRTVAVSPASVPPQASVSQPSNASTSSSSSVVPIIVSMAIACVAAFGLAFALRPGGLASIFKGDRNQEVVDSSQGRCTVTAGLLNVRSGPGVSNTVVDTLPQGKTLGLTGSRQNGWVEISSPLKGWVYNDRQFIDCSSSNQIPVEAKATPAPVKTPIAKPTTAKPKPPVDNGSDTLAKADEKYQNGDIEGAIAQAKEIISSGSASAKDAQTKIVKWQKDWTDAKAKYDRIQKALDEGRWDEVIRAAADPKLLEQSYWRDKLSQLIEEAKKRKAEAESNSGQPTTPPENPQPENPQPENPKTSSTEPVKPSPPSPGEVPATP